MANSKWAALRGSAGFYAVLAVCLIAAGVSGWFLLFGGRDGETEPEPAVPPEHDVLPVSEPVLEIPGQMPEEEVEAEPEEEPPAVETLSPPAPEPVETPVVSEPVTAEQPVLTVSPLEGQIVAAFSVDKLAYNPTLGDWRTHQGVDIAANEGAAVLAACAGVVTSIGDDPLMGTTVTIEHADGYQTTYANLLPTTAVELGDPVSAGQPVGSVGSTAAAESAQSPHLHFAVSKDGEAVDPEEFLNR